jgi:hypothetical protein
MSSFRCLILSLSLLGAIGGCGSEEAPVTPGRTMGAPPAPPAAETRSAYAPEASPADTDASERLADPDRENQAPVIVGVLIEPFGEVTVRHDIVAKPQAKDINDDPIEFRYTWRVNGSRSFFDGNSLPKSEYRRGDWIDLTVVATDGKVSSEPLASKPFEVTNAAPVITSSPGGFDAEGALSYQVEVEDPDDEAGFQYRLLEGPDGMQLDGETGQLTWTPSKRQVGTHSTKIEVVDSKGGKAWQSFDFEMDLVSGTTPAAPAPN